MYNVIVLVGVAVLFLVQLYWKQRRGHLYTTIEKFIHGPSAKPFFGNALDFPANGAGITQTLIKFSKQYDRFFRAWLGPGAYVWLYDPEDVEVLLSSTTNITKSSVYQFIWPWVGTGLLTSTGAKWKSRRKILTPTFHFKILEDFAETFETNGEILLEKLREKINEPAFDVSPYTGLYALDCICETAMGVSIHAQNNVDSSYVKAVKNMCNVVCMRWFQPYVLPDMVFNMSEAGRIQKNALGVLHTFTRDTIASRREEMRKRNSTGLTIQTHDEFNTKRKLAFLDLLLESAEGSTLSDQDIKEEVDTFMFAGHDTIATAIAFTLYALSKNPEVQERVFEEQSELFDDLKRPATHKDYQEMKYLERVIKEAMRLYPSVPIIGRTLDEDLVLRDGVTLPKGCQAFVFMPRLHTNPKIWPYPDNFDPDRFLPEVAATRSPYAHAAFSAGPRNCIGQRFAYMELKAIVSKVVRNFKLLPCKAEEEPRLVAEIVFISSNGVNVRLEERR